MRERYFGYLVNSLSGLVENSLGIIIEVNDDGGCVKFQDDNGRIGESSCFDNSLYVFVSKQEGVIQVGKPLPNGIINEIAEVSVLMSSDVIGKLGKELAMMKMEMMITKGGSIL